jgi:hypothetical protein
MIASRAGPLRLLAVTHAFAALRLLPMTHREKDIEILALPHQLTILQRQISDQHPQLRPEDRAFLAALLVPLSRATLRRLRLLVSPDTTQTGIDLTEFEISDLMPPDSQPPYAR